MKKSPFCNGPTGPFATERPDVTFSQCSRSVSWLQTCKTNGLVAGSELSLKHLAGSLAVLLLLGDRTLRNGR